MLAHRILLFCCCLCLLSLGGCDRSKKQLIGKWRAEGGSATIWEFRPNGEVQIGEMTGRYTLGDGRRLKIQTPAATFVQQMEFNGDQLKLTAPNGSTTNLTRAP